MSRKHAGHFKDKHPVSTEVDPELKATVLAELQDNQIACKKAFTISEKLSLAPSAVGIAIDMAEARIIGCQLGLFGYDKKLNHQSAAATANTALETTIERSVDNGRLSCISAWEIAKKENTSRLSVARACEKLSIKIDKCQLGAF